MMPHFITPPRHFVNLRRRDLLNNLIHILILECDKIVVFLFLGIFFIVNYFLWIFDSNLPLIILN
jgi:hypothetical protein